MKAIKTCSGNLKAIGITLLFLLCMYNGSTQTINSKVAAAQAAQRIAIKDTLQAVIKSFNKLTSCGVKVISSLEGSYEIGSAGEFISDFISSLLKSNATDNEIFIFVGWKGVGTGYELNKMAVEIDKMPKGLFPPNALATFTEKLQAYKETITDIKNSKVDKTIIAALQKLQLQANLTDSSFVCTECGRNLTVTYVRLAQIFPNNKTITQTHINYLNHALKEGGFTTCKRHAHFFSQVFHESANFTKFREDYYYRLKTIYTKFHKQSNGSHTTLFNQAFWDNNQHLKYIPNSKCEYLYEKKQNSNEISKKQRRSGVDSITYKHEKYTSYSITLPKSFKQDTNGIYRSYTTINPAENGKNLFNLLYNGTIGNVVDSDDGWTYRGRGAVHLTGRDNYQAVSNLCNERFGTNFDWINNPEDVATKSDAIVYSAAGWFMNNFKPISILDSKTPKEVTEVVNTGSIDKDKRISHFNTLMNNSQLYKCEPKKK